ncbi:MAG: hypothetical protein A3E78_11015 [Alphaproteobacteria bacterium RIFCSPHIGHO2_12_FULL_63_12]|nr:MAG: hypothetical protein A3E78_11015 [Alphaproteobacteria bacterium RIFCSPHIGHO2_12_FULL_63_12]
MKVSGLLTHARYVAELARIIRIASRAIAHETLRMHEGEFEADGPARSDEVEAVKRQIEEIMKAIE